MKRVLSIVLCTAILCTLPLCVAAEEEVTLRISYMERGRTNDLIEAVVAEFEKQHPNVDVVSIVKPVETYDVDVLSLLKGRNPPDVYYISGYWQYKEAVEAGKAADLTDGLATWQDRFVPAALEIMTWADGRIYSVIGEALQINVMWYNTNIFESLNLQEPTTWDEFMNVCRALRDAGVMPIMQGTREEWAFGNWPTALVYKMVGAEDYYATFNLEKPFYNPGFVKALKLIEDMAEEGFFYPGMSSLGCEDGMYRFCSGIGGINLSGSYMPEIVMPEDFELGAFRIPTPPGAELEDAVLVVNYPWCINNDSTNQELALEFLKLITDPSQPYVKDIFATSAHFPTVKGVDISASEGVPPVFQEVYSEYASSVQVLCPDEEFGGDVGIPWYNMCIKVAMGYATAEQALKDLDEELAHLKSH